MNSIILEHNRTVSRVIRMGLKSYGYHTDTLNFAQAANNDQKGFTNKLKRSIHGIPYSVAIIDTSSPNIKTASQIRSVVKVLRDEITDINIIGIILMGQWKLRVDFLNAGGDDAITYPFMMQELLARIQALIRRPKSSSGAILKLGEIDIDTQKKTAFLGDNELPLRKKEYHIIEYMALNKNRPVSRSELMNHVWDYKRIISSNTIDVHINKIRKKLPNPKLLRTVHGFGYMIKDSQNKECIRKHDLNAIKRGLT